LNKANREEIQPILLVKRGNNYNVLLKNAVEAQLMLEEQIKNSMSMKFNNLGDKLSTQQAVLNNLFTNCSTNTNNNMNQFSKDLKIQNLIRSERIRRNENGEIVNTNIKGNYIP